jgi:hypothetical protein
MNKSASALLVFTFMQSRIKYPTYHYEGPLRVYFLSVRHLNTCETMLHPAIVSCSNMVVESPNRG